MGLAIDELFEYLINCDGANETLTNILSYSFSLSPSDLNLVALQLVAKAVHYNNIVNCN